MKKPLKVEVKPCGPDEGPTEQELDQLLAYYRLFRRSKRRR